MGQSHLPALVSKSLWKGYRWCLNATNNSCAWHVPGTTVPRKYVLHGIWCLRNDTSQEVALWCYLIWGAQYISNCFALAPWRRTSDGTQSSRLQKCRGGPDTNSTKQELQYFSPQKKSLAPIERLGSAIGCIANEECRRKSEDYVTVENRRHWQGPSKWIGSCGPLIWSTGKLF